MAVKKAFHILVDLIKYGINKGYSASILLCRRLAMLIEGQCEAFGPSKTAQNYGFTRQRYYQILADFCKDGAEGLRLETPGPKTDYRRTDQVVRLVIRCRFLDPESSAAASTSGTAPGFTPGA